MLSLLRSRLRTLAVLVAVMLAGISAVAFIATLQQRSDAARVAQVRVGDVALALERLSILPHVVGPKNGLPPAAARSGIQRYREEVATDIETLRASDPPPELNSAVDAIRVTDVIVDDVLAVAIATGRVVGADQDVARRHLASSDLVARRLGEVRAIYVARAHAAKRQATAGTLITVLVLLGAFAVYYLRSVREHKAASQLAREKAELLDASRLDALTDALTGLHNRRALSTDLADSLARAVAGGESIVLALFDLDGFKRYNDTFGHAAGDELLTRLGRSLRAECQASGARAYRLGGDEFCVVYDAEPEQLQDAISAARAALTDGGTGWTIGTSVGVVRVPAEASDVETALVLADERMYRDKAERKGRPSTLQSITAELRTRAEDGTTGRVALMATTVAQHLHMAAEDVEALRLAADLHDIGKSAIPDSILSKRGELDDDEWAFIRNHTLTGGRLAFAAHARANTAALVRSSHEHFNGTGYPDGLAGTSIPLGARIIAVCDAFNAMTSERPFRTVMERQAAIGELRACAGTQFDPTIVAAFEASGAAAEARVAQVHAS